MIPVKFQFTISQPPWLFAVLLILSIGTIIWIYRRTVPPLPRKYRILLTGIRLLTLFILILLLCEAVFSISYKPFRKAVIALLIDDSESMKIKDGTRARSGIVRDILSSADFSQFQGQYDIKYFLFGEKVSGPLASPPDSLLFNDRLTDFSAALEAITKQPSTETPSAVLVLSDGVYTKGMDPVHTGERLGIPVYTVPIGKSMVQKDILLTHILANDIAYVNQEVPVHVSVRGPGYGGSKINVTIKGKRGIVSQKELRIPPDGFAGDVEFILKPDTVGLHKWTVTVSGFEDELTSKNNSRSLFIKVLPNQQRIFLLADVPSPDLAFMKRALQTKNIQCTARTVKNQSEFYEGPMLSSSQLQQMDVFILLNVPSRDTPAWLWDQVQHYMVNKRKPFFLVAGKKMDTDRLLALRSCLPFTGLNKRPEYSVLARIPYDGVYHPVVQLSGSWQESQKAWEELPPIYTSYGQVQLNEDATILLNGESDMPGINQPPMPLLISRQKGSEKAVVLLGSGFYRWDFIPWGLQAENDLARIFIHQLIRWLATREEYKQIQLSADKMIYEPGENVTISAQVYDKTYKPLNDAEIKLNVSSTLNTYTTQLSRIGNGLYQKEMVLFEGGRYQISAEADRYGQIVGRDSTFFIVREIDPELMNTSANPELMVRLARASGGLSGPPDSLAAVLAGMEFPRRQVNIEHRISPVHYYWTLFVLLLLLGMEWIIRKRRGLL